MQRGEREEKKWKVGEGKIREGREREMRGGKGKEWWKRGGSGGDFRFSLQQPINLNHWVTSFCDWVTFMSVNCSLKRCPDYKGSIEDSPLVGGPTP